MELEAYLQYVAIVFCLSFHGINNNEIMECGIGDVLIPEESTVVCYPSKENKILKEKCMLIECERNQTVAWKMLDRRLGKLEVRLSAIPEMCNFEFYDMDLEVYDMPDSLNESYSCIIGNSPWKTHSKRYLKSKSCSGCAGNSSTCLQMYTLIFKYVYPGWYRLKITPHTSDGSTRQSQVSYHFHVDETISKYSKKRLIDLQVNITLQYRDSVRLLDVGIPLLVDIPPEIVGFEVKYSPEYIDLYEITRYGSGNESHTQCHLGDQLSKPKCEATSGLIHCTFYNMSEGDYRIVVRFKDDRCTMSTIWTESILDSRDPCRWDIKREYNVEPSPTATLIDSSPNEVLYSALALCLLALVLLVVIFVKRRRSSRRRLVNQTDAGSPRMQRYNFGGPQSRFNFGQLLTLTDRPRPEVLLIYTRESPPFMELVASLRRILDKICKCKVYDYFDPDLWNDVSQDPESWVHTLIVERQAKVVIVASEVAAIRHKSLLGEFPELSYKSPHPFDNLFLYALKILRDGMDEESYKNHFVVTFDGFTETKYVLDYFNPYTRFILPKHLNKLFEHLHDSDSTVHFDTSSRLEERFEVRQLRLQLEHLINLKLLNHSDVEKKKLYDW